MDIHPERTESAFRTLGLKNSGSFLFQPGKENLFTEMELGRVSPAGFRNQLKKFLPASVFGLEIDSAWNAMLGEIPAEKMKMLITFSAHYRLFLLSNTNEIHLNAISIYLDQRYGVKNLHHIFEKEYYSCRLGLRKPDEKIFNYVLSVNHLNPAETLFIDDSPENVAAAARVGIKAIRYSFGMVFD